MGLFQGYELGEQLELRDQLELELPPWAQYAPDTPGDTFDPLSDPLNDPFPEELR